MRWQELIRNIPDWPKKGIIFRDITPVLQNFEAFAQAVEQLEEAVRPWDPQAVVGIEARGFIFGAALSLKLGVGFVPVRKKGKLPAATLSEEYALEYGTDSIEMHRDALRAHQRAVIVDDLLATGGTAAACARLVLKSGARLAGICFAIELADLAGREKLPEDIPVVSLLSL